MAICAEWLIVDKVAFLILLLDFVAIRGQITRVITSALYTCRRMMTDLTLFTNNPH